MQQRDEIHRELTRLLKSDTSIKVTLLGDRTGLTIARASRLLVSATMGAFDLESIGAIASAVFCGAAEQGSALTLGELGIMLAEFTDGKIFSLVYRNFCLIECNNFGIRSSDRNNCVFFCKSWIGINIGKLD